MAGTNADRGFRAGLNGGDVERGTGSTGPPPEFPRNIVEEFGLELHFGTTEGETGLAPVSPFASSASI